MTESLLAPMRAWLAAPMDHDVSEAIERLRHAPDVQSLRYVSKTVNSGRTPG